MPNGTTRDALSAPLTVRGFILIVLGLVPIIGSVYKFLVHDRIDRIEARRIEIIQGFDKRMDRLDDRINRLEFVYTPTQPARRPYYFDVPDGRD